MCITQLTEKRIMFVILAKAMTLKYIVNFLHVMTENFFLRKVYAPYVQFRCMAERDFIRLTIT